MKSQITYSGSRYKTHKLSVINICVHSDGAQRALSALLNMSFLSPGFVCPLRYNLILIEFRMSTGECQYRGFAVSNDGLAGMNREDLERRSLFGPIAKVF